MVSPYQRNGILIRHMASRNYRDTLLRGIALLGLIVVLVLGAWGIILLAFNLPSFLGGVSDSVSGLFTRGDEEPEVIIDEEPEVPTVVTPSQPVTPTRPTTPTTPNQPSYVYTPAAVAAPQLYGYADLKVTILSVVPAGNRYVMQFMVENAGTNVAYSGWNFNAILPLNTQYTYQAPGQQALNPGDRIVYTLGFDRPYYNQPDVCTMQYPNPNCPWYNNYNNDDCEWNDRRDRWECDDNRYYSYNDYPYYNNQNIWAGNRTVTVTIDPYNRVLEGNEYNNSAYWNLGNYNW